MYVISDTKERNRAWLLHNEEKNRIILTTTVMIMAVVAAMILGIYCVPSTVLSN